MKKEINPEETVKKGKLVLVGTITVGVACLCAGAYLAKKLKEKKEESEEISDIPVTIEIPKTEMPIPPVVPVEEAEESVEEPAVEIAEEIAEETAEEAVAEPAEEIPEAPVEEPAEAPVEEIIPIEELVADETEEVQEILKAMAMGLTVDEAAPAKALNTKAVEVMAEASQPDEDDYSGLSLNDLKIYVKTDYAHIKSNKITLGNDESVTITVEAPLGTVREDISVIYDSLLFSAAVDEPLEAEGKTFINVHVSGTFPCEGTVKVTTPHEEEKEEKGAAFKLEIVKLDYNNGRMVYWTPTGKKYHYDNECGGKNSTKTTVFDSVSVGLEPCIRCVLEAEE